MDMNDESLESETRLISMKKFILELNEEEALWLRSAMQNPLNGKDFNEESEMDRKMRGGFFNAVFSAGRK